MSTHASLHASTARQLGNLAKLYERGQVSDATARNLNK